MRKTLRAIAAMMLILAFSVSCNKPDESNNGENNGTNDIIVVHEYVDLGLPSGTLWATCNVGATKPEECGDYFAWGETAPKELYDWKSYKYGDYNRCELTKYCIVSALGLDGFADTLTVLESADDAATANWGADWRMPTKEEWEELYRKTACSWTTQNGIEGRLLTGVNGNSVFLPATGFRLGDELIGADLAIYWSSSLHSHFPERGWSFHYDLDECHVCGTYERCRGQVVRAVRVTK